MNMLFAMMLLRTDPLGVSISIPPPSRKFLSVSRIVLDAVVLNARSATLHLDAAA